MAKRKKGRSGKLDVQRNVKDTFNKENMLMYAEVLATALYCVFGATFFKLKGWGAYLMSYGVPAIIGAVLRRPAMVFTAVAGASLHAGFYLGDKMLEKNQNINVTWGIDKGTSTTKTTMNDQTLSNDLPPGVQLVNLNNRMVAIEPNNLNDYLVEGDSIEFKSPVRVLNDYVSSNDLNFNDLAINGTL